MTSPARPLFSVVIPTYNRAPLLPDTLRSVFAQRFTDFEVIVVDDGSTDGTAEYLASLGDRIRVVQQERRGPGASRNLGADVARGDYLAFLDSDDLWFPWSLEVFRTLIGRHERPSLVCGNYVQFAVEAELFGVQEEPVQALYFADYLASWQRHRVAGAGMIVVRRDLFVGVAGFRREHWNLEDHDFALRMGTAPGFVQATTMTLAWRRHPGGTTHEILKNIAGCEHLIRMERLGAYPGGPDRAEARRQIITQHTRSASLECVKAGLLADAWRIYDRTVAWHVALRRWKYLGAFPLYVVLGAIRSRYGHADQGER